MRGALRTRLAVQVVGLIGVLAASMWGTAAITLRQTSTALGDARADDLVRLLASSVEAAVEFEDVRGMEQSLALLQAADGATWAAVMRGDAVLASRAITPAFVPPKDPTTLDPKQWLVRRVAITSPSGAVRGDVVVVLSRAEEQATVETALLGLAGLAAVIAALGGLLAFFVARRVVDPVTKLTDVTTQIVSTNDLRSEPEVVGDDEVAGLARSFREMIRAQRRSLAGLARAIAELAIVGRRVDDAGKTIVVVADDIGQRVRDANFAEAVAVREIGDAMGIKSTNGVNDHLVALERKGYVRLHSTIARGLVLLVGRDDAPERALLAEAARVAPIGAVRAALDALPSAEVAHAA